MSSNGHNSIRKFRLAAGCAAALLAGGTGCLSMQSQTSLDGNGATNAAAVGLAVQPYVEIYVEYPGPQSKWSGPASFILHASAKDAGPAQINVSPKLLNADPDSDELSHRTPAAVGDSPAPALHRMTRDEARDIFLRVANALQGSQAPFRGCMSPLRVRLVRADGAIVERWGCRSELGWSRAVSDAVSTFVEASLIQAQVVPQRQAASAPKAPAAAQAEGSRGVASTGAGR